MSAALDAESMVASVEREKELLAQRREQYSAFLAQLRAELGRKEDAQADIAMIMSRTHVDSLQLAGDHSADEEEELRNSASKIGTEKLSSGGQKHFSKEYAFELVCTHQKTLEDRYDTLLRLGLGVTNATANAHNFNFNSRSIFILPLWENTRVSRALLIQTEKDIT